MQWIKRLQDELIVEFRGYANRHPRMNAVALTGLQQKFGQLIGRPCERMDRSHFMAEICRHPIVLYGDFHTSPESQRGFQALVQELFRIDRRMVILIESFRRDQQEFLDAFLADKISDERLRQLTQFDKSWGFCWEEQVRLLRFAKFHGIRVAGINEASGTYEDRDKRMADAIAEIQSRIPHHRLLCMVGEFHLVDPSLFGFVRQQAIRVLSELIDPPSAEDRRHRFFKAKDGSFLVLRTAPTWLKWQSYLAWEESDEGSLDEFLVQLTKYIAHCFQISLESICDFSLLTGVNNKVLREMTRMDSALTREAIEDSLCSNGLFVFEPYIWLFVDPSHRGAHLRAAGYLLYRSLFAVSVGDRDQDLARLSSLVIELAANPMSDVSQQNWEWLQKLGVLNETSTLPDLLECIDDGCFAALYDSQLSIDERRSQIYSRCARRLGIESKLLHSVA